jgi:hypothetical protein
MDVGLKGRRGEYWRFGRVFGVGGGLKQFSAVFRNFQQSSEIFSSLQKLPAVFKNFQQSSATPRSLQKLPTVFRNFQQSSKTPRILQQLPAVFRNFQQSSSTPSSLQKHLPISKPSDKTSISSSPHLQRSQNSVELLIYCSNCHHRCPVYFCRRMKYDRFPPQNYY